MKVKIKNVSEWKAILNTIDKIVEEAMFICNQDGITFRGMDPSHVCLLDITFPSSSFDEFHCETSYFGFRVDEFQVALNAATNDDIVELEIRDPNQMKVSINGSLKMEFNIKLLDRSLVNTPLPKINYKTHIILSPGIFSRIVSNLQPVSDYVRINSKPNMIEFLGKSMMGDAKIDIVTNGPELQIVSPEESSSSYSLEYMAHVVREIGRTSKMLKLEYASQLPIHMMFELPSSIKVEYYLAPRASD